jgi:uncharacterized protein
MLDSKIRSLLAELKQALDAIYQTRLRAVYLFGSHARGEGGRDSDVDVLVVLDRLDTYSAEVTRTGPAVSDLSLKYGVSISRVFVSEADWRAGETAFLASAREEAIPA